MKKNKQYYKINLIINIKLKNYYIYFKMQRV